MKKLSVAVLVCLSGCATQANFGPDVHYEPAQLTWQASASLDCNTLSYEAIDGNVFHQNVSGCAKKQSFLFIQNFWYPASSVETL